jgi:glycosyltransferase involved in cell wall biosynthesis
LHHRDAAFIIPFLKLRYKTVLTIHGFGTYELSNKWNKLKFYFDIQEKYFVRMADIITTMSTYEKGIIENTIGREVIYIPNGFPKQTYIGKERIIKDEYILFVAGRIISFKRCDVFLDALQKLHYKGKVVIVGDLTQSGDYGGHIIRLSKGLNIEFIGLLHDRSELFNIYSNARLFVFPSIREAMSMVLLEVVSVKTPVICSDIPGNADIFNLNEVLFFKTDNSDDLKEKLEWGLNNYDLMKIKAENAYNKLTKCYNWESISQKYADIYQRIYEGRK